MPCWLRAHVEGIGDQTQGKLLNLNVARNRRAGRRTCHREAFKAILFGDRSGLATTARIDVVSLPSITLMCPPYAGGS